MESIKLNLSQQEIAMSERANGKSAVNTISVKLHLPDTDPGAAVQAVNAAMRHADIFRAQLDCSGDVWQMVFGDGVVSDCALSAPDSLSGVREAVAKGDAAPLNLPGELYTAQVLPIREGGCMVYVRFHHIIIDGYGMSLFAQMVLDVLAGKEIKPSCFARHAGDSAADADVSFWSKYFDEAEFEPAVFTEKVRGQQGASLSRTVPQALCARMRSFATEQGVTIAYLFATAYALYLAEATGKKDAVFLMPRLNRRAEQMDVIGCYTLLVPMRVRVAQDDRFADLVKKVMLSAREASAHKHAGYDRILSALRAEDIINESLSEYVFNFYRYYYDTALNCEISMSVAGGMHNHVTFNIFRDELGRYSLRLDAHESVYTAERMQALADAILHILDQGMGNPAISDVRIVGDAEFARIMDVRGKSFPVAENLTIASLFRRAARENPDKPALYAGDVALTFRELDEVSDRIATALVQRGVKSGDRVTFMLNRDWRRIPTILGINKAGAAFIPVDPNYPPDRVTYIIENSNAAYMISAADVPDATQYSYLEADELIACEADLSVLPEVKQDQLAYIIYTSGTTGRPKGVMLSHKGIANITHPDNNPFNRDVTKHCKGIVSIGSICFDISLFEIFVPLFNGMFVVQGSEKAMVDAAELARHVTRYGADILHCTPSRIAAYLGNKDFASCLGSVKAILAAGEVLPSSLVEELRDKYSIRVYNGYGPTETTIGATITEAGDTTTIGLPIANMGVVMLSPTRKCVPFGAVGEICVYGSGVGIGYKDRPEETADKYIQWNGMRLYRTGDLGHLQDDGRVIYHGRNDRQIKLRGLRIELSEIEKVLGEYPGIAACSILVRKLENTEHLVGFYTVASGAAVDVSALRDRMKSRLTRYMVPDVLKELPVMPQTPNGKTDMKALAVEPIEYECMYRKPITHREQVVCEAFSKVLGQDKVGLDDNFFEMGGSSLDAASTMLLIEDKLELPSGQLDFGDLYKYPTPALLLESIYSGVSHDTGYDLASLDYTGVDAYLAAHTKETVARAYLGNVLVTGVTGYLGVHILIDLLKHPECCGKIVCLARPKRKLTAERRVKGGLFYYAEEDFADSYGEKWMVLEGDITDPALFKDACPVRIDTIINSAANVAHFAYGDLLERINTQGVKNLIDYALENDCRLCQVSTISVAGATDGSAFRERFTERDFYIGQQIHNQYIYSKYMAEYYMLRAAVDKGLKIKLLRVGNLQGRIQDGEFQMNINSNAFTRQLSSYIKIGAVPRSVYDASVNFSPVDETAHNIVALCATDDGAAAFNLYPPDEVDFADLFSGLARLDHHVEIVDEAAFAKRLDTIKKTEEGREQVEGLFTRGLDGDYRDIPVVQQLTNDYIAQLDEGWTRVTPEYLNQYLSALDGMDLF